MVAMTSMIQRCMFFAKMLKKVSYLKQIACKHLCRKIIWPGQVAWSTVYNNFV